MMSQTETRLINGRDWAQKMTSNNSKSQQNSANIEGSTIGPPQGSFNQNLKPNLTKKNANKR